MEKPIIRQIEPQRTEEQREITGPEAEEILRKYGYTEEFTIQTEKKVAKQNQNSNLTFEEMIRLQEENTKKIKEDEYARRNAPKPITFDPNNGYSSKVVYNSDDDLGFGFKIEITSNMKLP
jgi:hypothetical protein